MLVMDLKGGVKYLFKIITKRFVFKTRPVAAAVI